MKRTPMKRGKPLNRGNSTLKQNKPINQVSKKRKKKQQQLKQYMTKTTKCPICGRHGTYPWHHVWNGPYKWLSDKYHAYEYPCPECHMMADNNIHENEELRNSWKAKWQKKIMDREGMSIVTWMYEVGENWL